MKPEKGVVRDNPEKYAEKRHSGRSGCRYCTKWDSLTVDSLKKLSAGKLFNDLCGFNKKNKLGLKTPTAEEVKGLGGIAAAPAPQTPETSNRITNQKTWDNEKKNRCGQLK